MDHDRGGGLSRLVAFGVHTVARQEELQTVQSPFGARRGRGSRGRSVL